MTTKDNDLISRKALLEELKDLVKFPTATTVCIEKLITTAPTIESEASSRADSGESEASSQPVAWMYVNNDGECEQIEYGEVFKDPNVTPLYTSPQKQWVELTYDQKMDLKENNDWYNFPSDLIDATEKLLKEVNHG